MATETVPRVADQGRAPRRQQRRARKQTTNVIQFGLLPRLKSGDLAELVPPALPSNVGKQVRIVGEYPADGLLIVRALDGQPLSWTSEGQAGQCDEVTAAPEKLRRLHPALAGRQ